MSQNVVDFSGDPSGVELLDSLLTPQKNNFLTLHSGTSRPSYAQSGTYWLDKTTTPWVVKFFDGTDDIAAAYIDATANTFRSAGVRVDNVAATTDPTVNDDSADGYSVGSVWVNNTADTLWMLADSSIGAAVWRKVRYDTTAYLPLAGGALTGAVTNTTSGVTGFDDSTNIPTMRDVLGAAMQGSLNIFHNPGMEVAQRGTSGTVATGLSQYCVDGVILEPTGATVSWSQGTSFGVSSRLFSRYLLLTGNTSMTQTGIRLRFEGLVMSRIINNRVTFQMSISNSTGASITPQITVNYANTLDNFGAVTNAVAATNLQAVGNSTSATLAYTFDAPNSANGMEILITFGSALNANTKSVVVSGIDLRRTPNVSTGLNSNPPLPDIHPYTVAEKMCERYYEISDASMGARYHGDVSNTGTYGGYLPFRVKKRTTPTMAAGTVTLEGASSFNTTAPTLTPNPTGFRFDKSCIATSGDRGYNFPWTASAEL